MYFIVNSTEGYRANKITLPINIDNLLITERMYLIL